MKQLKTLIILGCIIIASLTIFCGKEEEEKITDPTPLNPIVIDTANNEVKISCVVNRMWVDDSVSNHNCIVSKYGTNGGKAVLVANVHHSDFYFALLAVGADPGVDIGDPPDTNGVPTGTEFKVLVKFDGDTTIYDINELVEDSLGREFKCRMHNSYARAEALNKGCIWCYTTCKTSITSNPSYTAYDFYYSGVKWPFRPIKEKWPAEGTHAVVIFRKVQ
ncbi:MAG: YdjY domain-containing protein [candidate division WOR-3 bacterium]